MGSCRHELSAAAKTPAPSAALIAGVIGHTRPKRPRSDAGILYSYTVPIRFAVHPLRVRGRVTPWREVVNQPACVGELRIEEALDEEYRRYIRAATLTPTNSVGVARPILPALLDVRIVAMSPIAFTLAGFERIEGVEYAQSWLVGAA